MIASNKPGPLALDGMTAIRVYEGRDVEEHVPRFEAFVARRGQAPLSRHPAWLLVLAKGLKHVPYCLEAVAGEKTRGLLALAYVRSWLFGRFLVSLPYLNYGGVVADDDSTARLLIDQAVSLAERLNARYLELRNEQAIEHPALNHRMTTKVHMRLTLPATPEALWQQLSTKVRNQVRKGQKNGLTVSWGGEELLSEFYAVFSHNMRDLGTPAYGRSLFRSILRQFPNHAEFCVIRASKHTLAAALLLHGWGITEVPSASSLRRYNHTCANMLMYWNLLQRSIEREQNVFDFGRSTEDSPTYRFKKQWGAVPCPAEWQYAIRSGSAGDMRPDNPKYQRLIRMWQRLPVVVTRWIGPLLVRGIP